MRCHMARLHSPMVIFGGLMVIGSDILGLENEHIYKYRRVCHSHFEDKHVCRYHRLSQIAVPTLSIPGLLSPVRLASKLANLRPMKIQSSTDQLHPEYEGSSSSGLRPPARTYSNRNPMQEVAIQPTLTLMPDPPSKQTPMQSNTSLEIDQEKCKENIDPDLVEITHAQVHRKIPAPSLQKPNKQGIVKQGKKNTKAFFTKMELSLHKKIISLRIKLSKMRHKAKQQSAHIEAAKRVASNPAANDFFENSSKIAKMLIHLQRRENKKRVKGVASP